MTGYSPWYHGLTSVPCFLRLFPGPFRAGIPDRLVLVGSGCASRRRAVSRASAYPGRRRGVRVGSSALARPSGRRLDRPSGLSFRYLGQPMSCTFVCNVAYWAEPLLGSRSVRDPGFMNPTGAPEPLGYSGRIVWEIFRVCQRGRFCFVSGCTRAHLQV